MTTRSTVLPMLICLAGMAPAVPAAHAAGDAEYAIRWDPAQGGPQTLDEIAAALGLRSGRRSTFTVQYFALEAPAGASPHFGVIARERTSDGAVESTWKLRGDMPLPAAGPLAGMRCPFARPTQDKREVDVGWTSAGAPRRGYSHSCDADGHLAQLLPAAMPAKPAGCSSEAVRLSAKNLKLERWSLPGGRLAFEVSSNGKDRPADLEKFERKVVRPLIAVGVRPLGASKTEMGSSC